MEKIQLVNNHAQVTAQLEERLSEETETRKAVEAKMKYLIRKHQQKEEKLQGRLQDAEEILVSVFGLLFSTTALFSKGFIKHSDVFFQAKKEKELISLKMRVEEATAENKRQVDALEKIVKARNQFYRNKYQV
jgi:hypothetical protein